MSDSDQWPPKNSLYNLAAVGGALLGALLLLGAYGHFAAVWPMINDEPDTNRRIALLFPGAALLATGLIDIALLIPLWKGKRRPLLLALVLNTLAMVYFGYLLYLNVAPDHPIGVFLALVASYVLLLSVIKAGLTWPATGQD
jgi:hypothetical protein